MSINLSIKGVPEPVAQALRERAERNHRSLQGELLAIVEHAAAQAPVPARAPTAAQPEAGAQRRGTKTIEQIAAEHRALYPEPFHGLPRAVDIIRALRDAK